MCFQLSSVLLPVFVLFAFCYDICPLSYGLRYCFLLTKVYFNIFEAAQTPLTLLCVCDTLSWQSRYQEWTLIDELFFLLFALFVCYNANRKRNTKQNEPYNYYEYGAINKQTNKQKNRHKKQNKPNSIRNPFHHTQAILPGIARISIVSAIDCIILLSTTVLLFSSFLLSSMI